jgi:hypothetical protein
VPPTRGAWGSSPRPRAERQPVTLYGFLGGSANCTFGHVGLEQIFAGPPSGHLIPYNRLMAYVDRSFIDSSPDDKLLRAFVTTGVKVVSALVWGDWIVLPNKVFQPPAAQKWFQDNWDGFREAADRVVNSLRDIKEDVWEKLRNAGLTWGHLKMKWQLWFDDLLSGRFNNILRRLNSILKSIATAIPLGECLAEYKEHVEMTLVDLANLNVVDATSLIDLSSAE